uniref:Uncharacterized protein n=1 Tax=Virgibacillus tibetensis TaxID=3042313 RepID=A0ABU6KEN9_9BACI|nr:hypothetical protein [Virgibacillus sp. C22-A2]
MKLLPLFLSIFIAQPSISGFLATEFSKEKNTTSGPTVGEVLISYNEPDIIQFNDLIYYNVSNIKHVNERGYEKGKLVGEVIKQSAVSSEFTNGVAVKLPVGAKVFQTQDNAYGILIVESGGKDLIYRAEIEG